MDDLKDKMVRGLFWSLSERLGEQAVQFVITIFLARLLVPEQFGLIGMLSFFMAVAGVLMDSGFAAALIQKKDATHLDICSVFYFNVFASGLLALSLFLAAPLIADFYNQPVLTPLTRLLSVTLLISGVSSVHGTLLTRRLRFGAQARIKILGVALSGGIGVALACRGYGVWSLAVQSVAASLMRTVMLWLVSDWRPSLLFSLTSLRGLFGFGSQLVLSGVVDAAFQNLYSLFIGKVFSATDLGYYTRAFTLRTAVMGTTTGALSRVMFPSLASIQDDLARLKRAYQKSMTLATFVHFPLMIGLMVAAQPLIHVLFSAKWQSSVPYFQLMCVAGLLLPLHVQNLGILKVKGRSDLVFRLALIKRSLSIVSICITYRWGVTGLLTGSIVTTVIAYFINSYYSGVLIGYPAKHQVLHVLPSFLLACLMGGGMFLAGAALPTTSHALLLFVQTVVGVAIYLGLSLLTKSESLYEIAGIMKRYAVPQRAA